jgi:paraquat-inducible protein A
VLRVSAYPPDSAGAQGLASCHVCYKLASAELHECPRCGATLHLRAPDSIQRTLALLVTAVLLYIPANVLPIMTTDQLGRSIDSTIIGGVILLVDMGSYPVAAVIFIASVLVPVGKFCSMFWLCWSVIRKQRSSHRQRTVLYRITEFVGRWSMTDVFVVTILVALIQMGGLLRITPGAAAVAFGGVVIVTMLAAESFDPRLIWDQLGDDDA